MSTDAPNFNPADIPRDAHVAIVAARFNQSIVDELLRGCVTRLAELGIPQNHVAQFRVPGAFELPVMAKALADTRHYAGVICLGCVIRGETPHFEYVAGEATRGLGDVAVRHRLPVGLGLLTVDTMQQAADRAGGSAGNKGHEAAAAAIGAADVIAQLRAHHAPD